MICIDKFILNDGITFLEKEIVKVFYIILSKIMEVKIN